MPGTGLLEVLRNLQHGEIPHLLESSQGRRLENLHPQQNMSNYAGIDYSGPGATCNRDKETGIRYGIIPVQDLRDGGGAFYDSAEQDYGEPHCPFCGSEIPKDHEDEMPCPHCAGDIGYVGDSCYGDSCTEFLNNEEYEMFSDESNDLWITKSPYYTYAQFCSPCAPGACHLRNPFTKSLALPSDPYFKDEAESLGYAKAFCLDKSWFDGDKAPYPVFSVATNELTPP